MEEHIIEGKLNALTIVDEKDFVDADAVVNRMIVDEQICETRYFDGVGPSAPGQRARLFVSFPSLDTFIDSEAAEVLGFVLVTTCDKFIHVNFYRLRYDLESPDRASYAGKLLGTPFKTACRMEMIDLCGKSDQSVQEDQALLPRSDREHLIRFHRQRPLFLWFNPKIGTVFISHYNYKDHVEEGAKGKNYTSTVAFFTETPVDAQFYNLYHVLFLIQASSCLSLIHLCSGHVTEIELPFVNPQFLVVNEHRHLIFVAFENRVLVLKEVTTDRGTTFTPIVTITYPFKDHEKISAFDVSPNGYHIIVGSNIGRIYFHSQNYDRRDWRNDPYDARPYLLTDIFRADGKPSDDDDGEPIVQICARTVFLRKFLFTAGGSAVMVRYGSCLQEFMISADRVFFDVNNLYNEADSDWSMNTYTYVHDNHQKEHSIFSCATIACGGVMKPNSRIQAVAGKGPIDYVVHMKSVRYNGEIGPHITAFFAKAFGKPVACTFITGFHASPLP